MCWCRPEIRTPRCDRPGCIPKTIQKKEKTIAEVLEYLDREIKSTGIHAQFGDSYAIGYLDALQNARQFILEGSDDS